jgi:hypothetical protein
MTVAKKVNFKKPDWLRKKLILVSVMLKKMLHF